MNTKALRAISALLCVISGLGAWAASAQAGPRLIGPAKNRADTWLSSYVDTWTIGPGTGAAWMCGRPYFAGSASGSGNWVPGVMPNTTYNNIHAAYTTAWTAAKAAWAADPVQAAVGTWCSAQPVSCYGTENSTAWVTSRMASDDSQIIGWLQPFKYRDEASFGVRAAPVFKAKRIVKWLGLGTANIAIIGGTDGCLCGATVATWYLANYTSPPVAAKPCP